jgi:hypothetical protein
MNKLCLICTFSLVREILAHQRCTLMCATLAQIDTSTSRYRSVQYHVEDTTGRVFTSEYPKILIVVTDSRLKVQCSFEVVTNKAGTDKGAAAVQ